MSPTFKESFFELCLLAFVAVVSVVSVLGTLFFCLIVLCAGGTC